MNENERKSQWGLWIMLVVNPFVILFVQNCSFVPTSSESQIAKNIEITQPHQFMKQTRGIASESMAFAGEPEQSPADRCKFVKKSCAE